MAKTRKSLLQEIKHIQKEIANKLVVSIDQMTVKNNAAPFPTFKQQVRNDYKKLLLLAKCIGQRQGDVEEVKQLLIGDKDNCKANLLINPYQMAVFHYAGKAESEELTQIYLTELLLARERFSFDIVVLNYHIHSNPKFVISGDLPLVYNHSFLLVGHNTSKVLSTHDDTETLFKKIKQLDQNCFIIKPLEGTIIEAREFNDIQCAMKLRIMSKDFDYNFTAYHNMTPHEFTKRLNNQSIQIAHEINNRLNKAFQNIKLTQINSSDAKAINSSELSQAISHIMKELSSPQPSVSDTKQIDPTTATTSPDLDAHTTTTPEPLPELKVTVSKRKNDLLDNIHQMIEEYNEMNILSVDRSKADGSTPIDNPERTATIYSKIYQFAEAYANRSGMIDEEEKPLLASDSCPMNIIPQPHKLAVLSLFKRGELEEITQYYLQKLLLLPNRDSFQITVFRYHAHIKTKVKATMSNAPDVYDHILILVGPKAHSLSLSDLRKNIAKNHCLIDPLRGIATDAFKSKPSQFNAAFNKIKTNNQHEVLTTHKIDLSYSQGVKMFEQGKVIYHALSEQFTIATERRTAKHDELDQLFDGILKKLPSNQPSATDEKQTDSKAAISTTLEESFVRPTDKDIKKATKLNEKCKNLNTAIHTRLTTLRTLTTEDKIKSLLGNLYTNIQDIDAFKIDNIEEYTIDELDELHNDLLIKQESLTKIDFRLYEHLKTIEKPLSSSSSITQQMNEASKLSATPKPTPSVEPPTAERLERLKKTKTSFETTLEDLKRSHAVYEQTVADFQQYSETHNGIKHITIDKIVDEALSVATVESYVMPTLIGAEENVKTTKAIIKQLEDAIEKMHTTTQKLRRLTQSITTKLDEARQAVASPYVLKQIPQFDPKHSIFQHADFYQAPDHKPAPVSSISEDEDDRVLTYDDYTLPWIARL